MQIFGLVKQAFLALLFLSFGGLLVTKFIFLKSELSIARQLSIAGPFLVIKTLMNYVTSHFRLVYRDVMELIIL